MQSLGEQELGFTQKSLMRNPKSYWVWHHRQWCMNNMQTVFKSDPSWKRELALCSQMLDTKGDPRNFHCWSYRRFVVANISSNTDKDEFEFSKVIINQNFSNYSAWHYRSALLPKLIIEMEGQESPDSALLADELELVSNAFFTEPEDQSGWLYQRWLLGRKQFHFSPQDHYPSTKDLTSSTNNTLPSTVYVTFSHKCADITEDHVSVQTDQSVPVTGSWSTVSTPAVPGLNTHYDHVFAFTADDVTVLKDAQELVFTFNPESDDVHWTVAGKSMVLESQVSFTISCSQGDDSTSSSQTSNDESIPFSTPKVGKDMLEGQIEMIQELLEDEEKSKWCRLALVFIMQELTGYDDDIVTMIKELRELDGDHIGYYDDLMSEYTIQSLDEHIQSARYSESRSVDLSKQNLSRISNPESLLWASNIDLSDNSLRNLLNFRYCINATTLTVDNNNLNTISEQELAQMSQLETLSLQNNNIASLPSINKGPISSSIECIVLTDNPVVSTQDFDAKMSALFPNAKVIVV
eukprot:TRINITY_DN790_c0_g1_i1.p1 TRINITY_DN790_c0_g1~~TRINITY_DN790_c0_g1_i1.p1  ORF type:complete len:613 (+),score=201.91 TRINITY_DN790_c0_g1_i1:276-1841(+)